jgi:hypothetical protein
MAYKKGQSVATNTLVKTGAGVLASVTLSCADSAPTAGSLTIYDSTTAAGTILFQTAFTTTFFMPVTVFPEVKFDNGIYVSFTTTADVNCVVSYES